MANNSATNSTTTSTGSSTLLDVGVPGATTNARVKAKHWLNVPIGKGLFGIPLDAVDKDGHRILKGTNAVVADQIISHYKDQPVNQMVDVTICGRPYKYYHVDDSTPKEVDTELTFD